jgi:hypothetical protein
MPNAASVPREVLRMSQSGLNLVKAFESCMAAVKSYSQSGRKVAESADTACTSGTSFAARIKTLNAKNVPIYGLSLTAH